MSCRLGAGSHSDSVWRRPGRGSRRDCLLWANFISTSPCPLLTPPSSQLSTTLTSLNLASRKLRQHSKPTLVFCFHTCNAR